MSKEVARLFESEVLRRGLTFSIDPESNRYVVSHPDGNIYVSLANLARDYSEEFDASKVPRFVDSVLNSLLDNPPWETARDSVFLCIESSTYVEPPEIRFQISEDIDKVPVLFQADKGTLTWIDRSMLEAWGASVEEMEAAALDNLAAALSRTTLEYEEIDGVRLGFLATSLPFKSALILAPNLKDVVADVLGWPLHAVVPDRGFLYLWDCRHADFAGRIGSVVLQEFETAPHPISAELLEIGDDGIRAVGTFSRT